MGDTMNKKIYIIGMIIIIIVSLSFGCAENESEFIELKLLNVEKTDCLKYLITFENVGGYIEKIDTENINDNNIFSFKINNGNDYKLYTQNTLIGGVYILYIPKSDVIV